MIIKLIETKAKPKEADRRARYLTRYLATADRRWLGSQALALDHGLTLSSYMAQQPEAIAPTDERVLFKGALINGEALNWNDGVAEVERRLAKRSAKVKKPVRHGVLSLREGERFTESQCAIAVSMLAAELGCEPSAILWAAHGDTDNFHLHFMFVTVAAATGEAVPFGRGPEGQTQWKDAMQRAIARIEAKFQLQPEARAGYRMEGQDVVRNSRRDPAPRKRTPIRQEMLDWEGRSGFVSFTRYAQEVAGPILDDAQSWADLHAALAPHGMGVRASVNGGELYADSDHVKLSNVDRKHSWGKLSDEKRFGPYVPPNNIELARYEPRVSDPAKASKWLGRQEQEREISGVIDRRVAALMAARDAALADATARISAAGSDIGGFQGDPRLTRDLAAAIPRLRSSTMAAIRGAFASRIDAVRALRHAVATCDHLPAINVEKMEAFDAGFVAPWSASSARGKPVGLEGYDAEQAGDVVRYWRADDRRRQGQPALIDTGQVIWVNDRSEHSIATAISLTQRRFGQVAVFGDASYLQQCAAVSEKLGISITVITVAEGQRRARETIYPRNSARRRALQAHAASETSAAVRRRKWRDAYRRAMPADTQDFTNDERSIDSQIPHHSLLPTLATLLGRVTAAKPPSKTISGPRPSLNVGIEQ